MKELGEQYAATNVDVLGIYIAEAHSVDEWPVGNPIKYAQ